jgi:hypothetical protein
VCAIARKAADCQGVESEETWTFLWSLNLHKLSIAEGETPGQHLVSRKANDNRFKAKSYEKLESINRFSDRARLEISSRVGLCNVIDI